MMNRNIFKNISKISLSIFMLLLNYISIISVLSLTVNEITDDKLIVRFYDMGNADCIFIKFNNTEILIDSGDKEGKLDAIKHELKSLINDGVLDYVFVTHGDSDHIRNMPKLLSYFDDDNSECFRTDDNQSYVIDTLIDFDTSNAKKLYADDQDTVYTKYVSKRYALNKDKNIVNYYPIDKYFNNYSIEGDCSIEIDENLIIHFLYNKYYFEETTNANLLSVCIMLQYGESKVVLTGDLEASGEYFLIDKYKDTNLLNDVTLFKAGHHGSNTSNTELFIDMLKPKYVMITCCAGLKNYNFPKQEALNNFLTYTDYIFISSYRNEVSNISSVYHGDVTFYLDELENVEVEYENKASNGYALGLYEIDENGNKITNPIIDTKWFKENRNSILKTYVFSGYQSENNAYLGNCTLIKYGHYDILIDCGNYGTIGAGAMTATNYIEDVKEYCIDGVLEYVIVSSPLNYSISQMIDVCKSDGTTIKGILNSFEIKNLIDFGNGFDPSEGADVSMIKSYLELRNNLIVNGTNYFSAKECTSNNQGFDFEISSNFYFDVLKNKYYEDKSVNKFDSSVSILLNFYDSKLLFIGNLSSEGEYEVVKENSLEDVSFFLATDFGDSFDNSRILLDEIKNDQLTIAVNSILNEELFGKKIMNKALCDRLINCSEDVYVNVIEYNEGKYSEINGDIIYTIDSCGNKFIDDSDPIILSDTEYFLSLF